MANISTSSLTPENLGYIIDGLGDGDAIVITRKGGKTNIQVKHKGQPSSRLENRLSFALGAQPVKAGWMSTFDEPVEKKPVTEKKAHKPASEKTKHSNAMVTLFELGLLFKTLDDAIEIRRNALSQYYKFQIKDWFVYTDKNMRPVMYSKGEGGMIYL